MLRGQEATVYVRGVGQGSDCNGWWCRAGNRATTDRRGVRLRNGRERVRQLEANRVSLLVRKARLEAQRDERESFMMPLFVGLNTRDGDFERVYSFENDIFSRSEQTYQDQLATLEKQRPSIEAEIKAVTAQIAKQNEQLDIVNSRLADLEPLFSKGLLRKETCRISRLRKRSFSHKYRIWRPRLRTYGRPWATSMSS